jgi:hypothetical protein
MRRTKLLTWILAGLALLTISSGPLKAAVPQPSEGEIQALEREISMPAGARPVSAYDRYYAAAIQDGRRVIHGIYFGNGGKTTIEASGNLPVVMDGGCGVVNVDYDVESHKFIRVFCNGVA